ncbi:MAG: sigma-70 family RNA polymerase sigma factor [Acidimicrobiia bacterium]
MRDASRHVDPAAEQRFEAAFRTHFAEVLAYLRRRLPADEANDAAADVFAVAWRRSSEFDDEIPIPWLLGVAYRVTSEHYRSRRRRTALVKRLSSERQNAADDPARLVASRGSAGEALAAFTRLRPRDQELLRLAALEDLTTEQMAEVLGLSPSAVRTALSRARDRFHRELAEDTGS